MISSVTSQPFEAMRKAIESERQCSVLQGLWRSHLRMQRLPRGQGRFKSNTCGKHESIRQRLLETYERILFCVRWPQTPDAVRIKIADPESPGSRISKGPCRSKSWSEIDEFVGARMTTTPWFVPVARFGGSHVGGFGGTGIGGFAGSPVGGFAGSFGSHLSGLSGGGFHNDPLAINTGRFTSPSALVGEHTAAAGARLNMRYRRYHGRRYYANHCFIAANDPYSCQPYSSCPCSTLP